MAACETPRLRFAAVGEQGDMCVAEQFDFSHETVASVMETRTAGVTAKGVAHHSEWIGVFERLDGRVERVGHVGMVAACSVSGGRGSEAAGDGFVVGERLILTRIDAADGEVIHGAGACGRDAIRKRLRKGAHEHVDDALRCFDVAAGDSCRWDRH